MTCLNWDSSVVGKVPQGAHGERVVILGFIHGKDTINNFLNRLLRKFEEPQSGSKGLTESGKEGLLQIVSRDFPSKLTV